MERIDRLGWAAGLCFVCYGVRIGIRVNRPEVLEPLRDYLPPGWEPTTSPAVDHLYSLRVGGSDTPHGIARFCLLYSGPARVAQTRDLCEAFERLESELHLQVAVAARGRLFVHAGVVGWRGRGIVIPGRSFSGKTTLVAALVRAGATYYSDEYAVFDASGCVHPYPKPLTIRGGTNGRRPRYSAEALGGSTGVNPLPVGLVAVSEYRPGAQWRPRPLPPGKAVLALLANTVPARKQPQLALATLGQVVSQALVLKGIRGEAEHLVPTLLNRFDS